MDGRTEVLLAPKNETAGGRITETVNDCRSRWLFSCWDDSKPQTKRYLSTKITHWREWKEWEGRGEWRYGVDFDQSSPNFMGVMKFWCYSTLSHPYWNENHVNIYFWVRAIQLLLSTEASKSRLTYYIWVLIHSFSRRGSGWMDQMGLPFQDISEPKKTSPMVQLCISNYHQSVYGKVTTNLWRKHFVQKRFHFNYFVLFCDRLTTTVRLVQKRPNWRIAYLLYFLFDFWNILHVNLQ